MGAATEIRHRLLSRDLESPGTHVHSVFRPRGEIRGRLETHPHRGHR